MDVIASRISKLGHSLTLPLQSINAMFVPRKTIFESIIRTFYCKTNKSHYVRSYDVSSQPVWISQLTSTIGNPSLGDTSYGEQHKLQFFQTDNDETISSSSPKILLNFQKLIKNEIEDEMRRADDAIAFVSSHDIIEESNNLLVFPEANIENNDLQTSLDLLGGGEEHDNDLSDHIINEEKCTPPVQPPHDRVDDRNGHRNVKQQQLRPAPNMTIYQYKSTDETYFQWDYRYHPEIKEWNVMNMLIKIERTLKDAHLEPYGKLRGVDTVRQNIINLDVTEKFRLGRNKSLQKGKISCKFTRDGVQPDYKKTEKRMKRLLRPIPLLRSILKIIYERHAIYASGYSEQIAHLDPFCLGESFFGPDTNVRVDYDTARLMLRELWLHGHSSKFNKLQWQHNIHQERLKERNYRPKLTD